MTRLARSAAPVLLVLAGGLAAGLVAAPPASAASAAPAAVPPDPVVLEAREQVTARHALEREAHMDRNLDLLLSLFADDFVLVDGGEVQRPTPAANRERFGTYFRNVRFLKWDDLAPPAVRVSRDGTLATVIVRKEVVLLPAEAPEGTKPERAVFAWMETWEKRQGRWMLTALASTRAAE